MSPSRGNTSIDRNTAALLLLEHRDSSSSVSRTVPHADGGISEFDDKFLIMIVYVYRSVYNLCLTNGELIQNSIARAKKKFMHARMYIDCLIYCLAHIYN